MMRSVGSIPEARARTSAESWLQVMTHTAVLSGCDARSTQPGVSRSTNWSSTFRDNFETLMPRGWTPATDPRSMRVLIDGAEDSVADRGLPERSLSASESGDLLLLGPINSDRRGASGIAAVQHSCS
jgi:hypothetical protein